MDIKALMRNLVEDNASNIALLVGNGINRYRSSGQKNSWDDLLLDLANRYLPKKMKAIPHGLELTELYDLLDMVRPEKQQGQRKPTLQDEFCKLMVDWTAKKQHRRLVNWSRRHDVPMLTTNFEDVLSQGADIKLYRIDRSGTDYYPWEAYYSDHSIVDPSREFGIWHVNGMQEYSRSIRLGLTHYMGSVERARGWLHRRNEKSLFQSKNEADWRGSNTWLHVIFNKPLIV